MKLLKLRYGGLALALLVSFVGDAFAAALGTAFTYQGRLKSAGQPANGNYDLRFTLYDAPSGGGQVGSPVTLAPVVVTNGAFTVFLDFGAAFSGDARWLEIGVRTNGSGGPYGTPSARQPLTPSPYALYAPSAGLAATATTAATANNLAGSLNGDVTGTQTATMVARVGGQTATDVANGSIAANAATSANTPDRIVRRDGTGNFSAGTITAASLTGNGAGLTALNASNLATGTLADGRLSGNVALLNASQIFSGSNTFSGVSTLTNGNNRFVGTFSGNGAGLTNLNASQSLNGDGAGLTNLNASQLASGTVPGARLAGAYPNALTFNSPGNSFSGGGAGLTGLNANNLATGTLADGRLSGNVALLNANQVFSGSNTFSGVSALTNANNRFVGTFTGNGAGLTNLSAGQSLNGDGAGLTNLNASQLASGTVPGARLGGTYPNALTFNNPGNSFSGSGAGLTSLNAGALTSGTVPSTQISGTYSSPLTFNNPGNSFTGNGAGLSSLNAGALTIGTVPSAQILGTYSSLVNFNNAGNTFSGGGAGLTSLNAGALASGTVPDARLSGTYSSAVTFNNAGNSFTGNGAGLSNVGLVRTTVLNVPCDGSGIGVPYSTTSYTKVADIGTFTKQLANSTIEVTFNGRTYATYSIGFKGAIFELRVDNTATSNGRARAGYSQSGVGVQTSITGIFTGLAATTHTVSMWIQGVGIGGTGAQLDPGCYATDHVVVKEFK